MGSVYGISMGGGTGYITNPMHMGRWVKQSNSTWLKTATGANGVALDASWLSIIDRCGAYLTIADNAGYYTVCNITGSGFFVWAVSTQYFGGVGQSAPYLKITLDGSVYEIAQPILTDAYRFGIGSFWLSTYTPPNMIDTYSITHAGVNLGGFTNTGLSDDKGWFYQAGHSVILPHALDAIQLGLPLCRFSSSLKVEAKNVYTSGAAETRSAAVCYMLDIP